MKKILISQSNYIPWKGYFDNIAQCYTFVILDDVQYTKRDWRNRNYIKTPNGLKWLTIPVSVKGKRFQGINETEISDSEWKIKHWEELKYHYRNAPSFKQTSSWIEHLYMDAPDRYLTLINTHFIREICQFLGIKTEIIDSRNFRKTEGKNERLMSICKHLGPTDYLSGPAAKNYLDLTLFAEENIKVHFSNYEGYMEYNQLYPPFEHGVSILDLIFNLGDESKNYLKFIK